MPITHGTAQEIAEGVIRLRRALKCLVQATVAKDESPTLMSILFHVSQHGGRAVDIAQRLGVTTPVVSRQIAELEEKGLVTRTADPQDGRAQLLQLTESGAQALQDAEQRRGEMMQSILSEWSDTRGRDASEILNELSDALLNFQPSTSRNTAKDPTPQNQEQSK